MMPANPMDKGSRALLNQRTCTEPGRGADYSLLRTTRERKEDSHAGAQIYREHCAACHGTANGPKTAAAKGMFPPPPQFFQGEDVTDDPVGYTF
jgi:mono/diheme cytochrome c family protein